MGPPGLCPLVLLEEWEVFAVAFFLQIIRGDEARQRK